jgi:IS5 family transposase
MSFRIGRQQTLEDWLQQPQLDPNHWLVRLADRLPWDRIAETLRQFYSLKGRLAKQVRMIVGLLVLKHLYELGDRVVVSGLQENLYWQYFCGVTLPRAVEVETKDDDEEDEPPAPPKLLHPTVLTKFRRRVGAKGLQQIEEIVHQELKRMGLVKGKAIAVDTTAQPKNIIYPTETGLLDRGRRMIVRLVRQVGKLGVKVQAGFRSFRRVARRVVIFAAKLGKGRLERVKEANEKLSAMARHVIQKTKEFLPLIHVRAQRAARRGVKVLAKELTRRAEQLQHIVDLTECVIRQNAARWAGKKVDKKILSLHEPHVVAIVKGKRNAPIEFGTKVVLAMEPSGVIVGHRVYGENVADVKTLKPMIDLTETRNGRPLEELAGDRGMHHRESDRDEVGTAHIPRISIPTQGKKPARDAGKFWFRRLQKFRARQEPIIGHLKQDHGMGRSRYKGLEGDQINVSLCSLAWNLKKMARAMEKKGHRGVVGVAGAMG